MSSLRPGRFTTLGGGGGWIRTSVRLRGQIYSLLPLTTRPPLQEQRGRHVAAHRWCVNAPYKSMCRSPLALHGSFARTKIRPFTGWSIFGAGEGNRTPVVSLEGFCSTIELHPQTFGKKCFSPEKPKSFYRRLYTCPRIRSPIATTILPWSTYVRRMPSTWSGDQPISSAIS